MRFLRRTTLGVQVQEACAEYRSLKIKEYRTGLKMQRIDVQMRVMDEVMKARTDKVCLRPLSLTAASGIPLARFHLRPN